MSAFPISFGFGSSSDGSVTWGEGSGQTPIPNMPFPQVPTVPTQTQTQGNNTDWWSRVTGVGLATLGSVLGYKLQQNQVNHGQYPSVGLQGGFFPTGQGVAALSASNTSWLFWIAIAVVILLMLRR